MSPSRNLTITPRRILSVRCSAGMWCAVVIQFVGACSVVGALIWALSSYKTTTELRINNLESSLSKLAEFVYGHPKEK